jgi:hypothetical protein
LRAVTSRPPIKEIITAVKPTIRITQSHHGILQRRCKKEITGSKINETKKEIKRGIEKAGVSFITARNTMIHRNKREKIKM